MATNPRRELRAQIEKLPGGFAQAAELLGVTRNWLYMICNGDAVCMKLAAQIRDHFGIPVEAWASPPKKRKRAA